MGNQGTAVVDFGAFPGTTDAFVVVTGQTGIVAGSLVEAWIRAEATAVHSADEHVMANVMLDVVACEIVAGTGFTIRVLARDLGGEMLKPAGAGRRMTADTAAANNQTFGEQAPSFGGQALNHLWGTFNVAWVWN